MASSRNTDKNIKIVLSSPVILCFVFLCVVSLIANVLTNGTSNHLLFSVYQSSLTDFFTYIRFFAHVFGHANLTHLINNIMLILVLGPVLEEKYGSDDIAFVILITALVTGIVHFIFFPGVALMGASGVVFAFILLTSAVGFKEREIPLTFILVALLYLGEQIYEGIFEADNVSQLTHILGGLVGAFFGYRWRKK